jgi:hypothetical protein
MATLADYKAIERWLGSWLQQLVEMGDQDDYRVILSEIGESEAHPIHLETLSLLDNHIQVATQVCRGFARLIGEKSKLPSDLDEANKTVLSKLSEVRAVVGLDRLNFTNVEFSEFPDLTAERNGRRFAVEVTHFGYSEGKRSRVWDQTWGSIEDGVFMGMMTEDGPAPEAISEAIYREIEQKYPQLKRSSESVAGCILWISLGRDYFAAHGYQLFGADTFGRMTRSATHALEAAVRDIVATDTYELLSHVVLCPGRDHADLVVPGLDA